MRGQDLVEYSKRRCMPASLPCRKDMKYILAWNGSVVLLSLICQDPQDARDVLEFLNQFLVVIYLGPYTHLFIILVYRLSICAIISKTCCCYLGSVTITRFQSAVHSVVDTGCRLNGPPEPIQTHLPHPFTPHLSIFFAWHPLAQNPPCCRLDGHCSAGISCHCSSSGSAI